MAEPKKRDQYGEYSEAPNPTGDGDVRVYSDGTMRDDDGSLNSESDSTDSGNSSTGGWEGFEGGAMGGWD